jgi:DNA-damage-inducible protein J
MEKSVLVSFRTKPELKKKADVIFEALGISKTEAFNMFLSNVILNNGIPFDVKIPNKETLEAVEDVENKRNLTSYKSSDYLENLKKMINAK